MTGMRRVGIVDLLRPTTLVHLAKVVRFHVYSHALPRREIVAGPGLRMSPTVSLRNGSRLRLGRDVHVGERCCLWAGNTTGTITLGDNALLAPEVFITASNYGTEPGVPVMYQETIERDVVVGSDVWLGARVIVLPGVTIGDGAVVGAGAVVAHDLPAGCIAVGVPARVVGWRDGVGSASDARAPRADVSGSEAV